jgi:predicted transglutaminase-like cysteine proteinase
VVRTDAGDLVADNLNADIRPWTETSYQWIRIQSPDDPLFWRTVAPMTVLAQSL